MKSILEDYLEDLLDDSGFEEPVKSNLSEKIFGAWKEKVEAAKERGMDREEAEFEVFRTFVPSVHSMLRYSWNRQVRSYLIGLVGMNLCFLGFIGATIWTIGFMEEGYKTELILSSFCLGAWLVGLYSFDSLETVRIEGGTRIVRRLLFRRKVLQIADIQEITTRRSCLLIFEKVFLKTETDRLSLDWGAKGHESVLAVLCRLRPEIFRPKSEGISTNQIMRIVLLAIGLLASGCYLVSFPALWKFEGLSYFLLLALPLGVLVSVVEIFFHADRAKVSLVWFRLTLLTPLFPFLLSLTMGKTVLFQWIALLWLLFFMLMVLSLVWWGRSAGLVKVSVVLMACGLLFYFLIPPVWRGEKKAWVTASDFTNPFVWIGNERIAMIDKDYDDPSRLMVYTKGGLEKQIDLGFGSCEFLEPYSEGVLTLRKSSRRVSDWSEEIVLCNINGTKEILPFDPKSISVRYSDLSLTPFWSPDRSLLLLREVTQDASGEKTYTHAVGNPRTGEIRKFEGLVNFLTGKWLDEEEIRAVEIKNCQERSSAATDEFYVRTWALNPKTGAHEMIANYPLSATMRCWAVPGGEYALLIDSSSIEQPNPKIPTQLIRLNDGARIDVPPLSSAYGRSLSAVLPNSWSNHSKRLAYLAEIDGTPHVTVVDPDGFQSALPLAEGQAVGGFSISPDGGQVIFGSYFPNEHQFESIMQVHHWKVGEKSAELLRVEGLGFGFLFDLFNPERPLVLFGFLPSQAKWSPNSKRLAVWGMMEEEGLSSPLLVYDFE